MRHWRLVGGGCFATVRHRFFPKAFQPRSATFVTVPQRMSAKPWQVLTRALACAASGLALAGCGSSADQEAIDEAKAHASASYAQWRRDIASRARTDPRRRFPNLPPRTLRARLDALSRTYKFRVEDVRFLRPKQFAPVVVVSTTDKHALSRATPAILRRIDPKRRTADDRNGWAYEAFFFEARDEDGTPFLVVFNYWRRPSAGGGQWASEDDLLPFATL